MIDAAAPAELDVHVIMGNYRRHKTALIRCPLAVRARFHVHFTSAGRLLDQLGGAILCIDWEADPPRRARTTKNSSRRSGIASRSITMHADHSAGQDRPMRFSPASPYFVNEAQLQDTLEGEELRACGSLPPAVTQRRRDSSQTSGSVQREIEVYSLQRRLVRGGLLVIHSPFSGAPSQIISSYEIGSLGNVREAD